MRKFFTSESVTEGHPDKICDQISDVILDAILKEDKKARVACECVVCTDYLLIMGEVTTTANVDYESIAREKIKEIGYTDRSLGFSYDTVKIDVKINKQSADIAMGVDASLEHKKGGEELDLFGAGDQGLMFGYASRETKELMPLPIMLAHKICKKLSDVRKNGEIDYLRPDGKGQVTIEYDGNKPIAVSTVVLSSQHEDGISHDRIEKDLIEKVVKAVIPESLINENTKYLINPTGNFVIGGPNGDSGLTGRKIIVDTYGGKCAHGGGAFSGKDPTKVDRSATYMARYVAKNIVAASLADECEIQIAYAIGVAKPVSVYVNTFGTGKLSDEEIASLVVREFDLRPYAIIKNLGLQAPIYSKTSSYGHFGKDGLPWEKTDRVSDLKKYL